MHIRAVITPQYSVVRFIRFAIRRGGKRNRKNKIKFFGLFRKLCGREFVVGRSDQLIVVFLLCFRERKGNSKDEFKFNPFTI